MKLTLSFFLGALVPAVAMVLAGGSPRFSFLFGAVLVIALTLIFARHAGRFLLWFAGQPVRPEPKAKAPRSVTPKPESVLDGIARGMGGKSYRALSPEGKRTVDELARRIA